MTGKLKKVIIIITILFTITLSILVILLFQIQQQEENKIGLQDSVTEETEILSDAYDFEKNKIEIVKLRNEFFIVQSCIESFYNNYLTYNNSGTNSETVYNLLDDEYVEMFSISQDDLKNKFGNYNSIKIDITKIYKVQVGIGKNIYFAYGYLVDSQVSNITDLAIGVKIDNYNSTFSILPYEYLERKKLLNIDENSSIELNTIEKIENKTYNVYKSSYPNDETYVTTIFENYINRALYNIDLAYKSLDNEYKEKRFINIQEYKTFIEKNRQIYMSYNMQNAKKPEDFENVQDYLLYLDTFKKIELISFDVSKQDGYTQYVCIDSLDNYYIFRETNPMQYTVILDTYTIDLPEFLNKYKVAEEKTKVSLNIEKIRAAINENDYRYVYNKLDSTFKQNNYPNYDNFSNYIKSNFFDDNLFEYKNIEKHGELYVANIIINNTKKMDVIMKLSNDTNFYISFNIEE